jgi:glycosyltransferase involved in cell wall biosynthesis
MSQPHGLISVIVPCFNQGSFLAEALESIVRQTYEKWECLIIDDGSTDSTPQIASRFVGGDARFRYFHQTNKGPSASRNRGLSLARGDLIQFLDADDVILPGKFELQVAALGPLDVLKVVHCDYLRSMTESLTEAVGTARLSPTFMYRKPVYDLALRWERDFSIPIHCFLFDSRIFTDRGVRFDESLLNHEDWECWMRVFALQPESVFIDKVLAVYRTTSGSLTSNRRAMFAGFLAAVAKQTMYWSHDPTVSALLRLRRRRIEHAYGTALRRDGRATALRSRLARVYARTVPWPVRRAVTSLRALRLEPAPTLLREIVGVRLEPDTSRES